MELEIKQATLIDPLGITTDVKNARKAEANKRYYYRRIQRDPDAYRKDYHRRRKAKHEQLFKY